MPVKVLEHGESYAIVGDGNGLRVVDRPKRCQGYQHFCTCKKCLAREGRKVKRPEVAYCECDAPLSLAVGTECFRCGKSTRVAA